MSLNDNAGAVKLVLSSYQKDGGAVALKPAYLAAMATAFGELSGTGVDVVVFGVYPHPPAITNENVITITSETKVIKSFFITR